MKKRRPKRRRKEETYRSESEDDAECQCPKNEPKALGLKHVPKHPSPEVKLVPGPKAGPWRTNPPTYTPPPREAGCATRTTAPASLPPAHPKSQPTHPKGSVGRFLDLEAQQPADNATPAPATPQLAWTSWNANAAWWDMSSWPAFLPAAPPEPSTSSSTAASSTSSGTSASGVAADVQPCKIAVAPDQVLWLPLPDGSYKLNVKISPVDTPVGMKFRGYCWEGKQAYAFFTRINANEDDRPMRRPRPRGGTRYH